MRTRDEILARMAEIDNAAELDDALMTEYEALEVDLAAVNRADGIRARQVAYNSPAPGQMQAGLYAAPAKPDDTLNRAYNAYLRSGKPNADISALAVDANGIRAAQTTTPDSAGGFTVAPEFRQKLVEVRKSFGGLAAEVDGFNTGTGSGIEYPTLDDTANEGQITAEGANYAGGADAVFGTVTLGAFKYTSAGTGNAPLKLSFELAQDSAFDIEGVLARLLGTRIARKQARDWVNGAGTTLPFGIARTGLAADVTLAAGNAITYNNLLDLDGALDPEYEENAKWCMSKATFQNIRKLVDTTGRPLIQTQQTGIDGKPQRMLLGYPIVRDQGFSVNTTLSGRWAVLGDLREAYVIRRVSNLVVVVNPYSSASSGQIEYTAWERADGTVQNRKAYTLAGSNAA